MLTESIRVCIYPFVKSTLVDAVTSNSNYKMVAPEQEQGEFRDVNMKGLQMGHICHTTSH